MALANLAVEFKLKGAGDAQRQVEQLGSSFGKLASSVDKSAGILRNAFSTALGMLGADAIRGTINAVTSGIGRLSKIPGELMNARMDISKARADLVGAGMDAYEVRQFEKSALEHSAKWGNQTADAYMRAAYEIQSSIPKASMIAKKAIVDASAIMAGVTSMSQEEATKMMASLVHTFNFAEMGDESIVKEMQKLAGYFKGTIDVGVFRGPEMMEMLKESVPLLKQKGWDAADIMAAATFWKTQGFRASSTGVAMREWGQRITPAAAWMKVAGDVYEKQGESGLKRLMTNTLKFKPQFLQAQKDLFESGFTKGGMKVQMDEYFRLIQRIPEWTRDHMRKKGEHEALQPYVNSAIEGYKKLIEMYKDIAGSTYEGMTDKAKAANEELFNVQKAYEQVQKNVRTELASTYEPMWIKGLQYLTKELEGVRVWITDNMPLLRSAISSFGRGLWDSFKKIEGEGFIGDTLRKIKELADSFSNKGQLEISLKGFEKGSEFGDALKTMALSITNKFDTIGLQFENALSVMMTIADAIGAVAKWFGYEPKKSEREKDSSARYEESNISAEAEKIVDGMTEQQQRSDFWTGILSFMGSTIGKALEANNATAEQIRAAYESSKQSTPDSMGITGTLTIRGDVGTLSGTGKPNNTANAMGQ